ncbi:MAG TPA: hypothetical protein VF941_20675 [Clostridia bacterium]
MNRSILRDIIKLKMDISEGLLEHLPDVVKERVNSLQHNIMVNISEAANEYLDKNKPDGDNKNIKKVSIE